MASVAFADQPGARVAVVVAGLFTIIVVDGLAVIVALRARQQAVAAGVDPSASVGTP